MKFWKNFRYEVAYQLRSFSPWLYLGVLITFTILMKVLVTPGDGVYANNTFYITGTTVLAGMLWLVMGAAISGESSSRDVQTQMHSLTYTTPATKFEYLGGRFLAAFVINALLILSVPLAVLLSFYLPGMDQGGLLPFRPAAYLNVYFLIALPNVFVATALQFAFATVNRQPMSSYIASILLAIFPQLIASSAASLFGNWDLLKLLDPIGVAGIVGSELGTWTPAQKNTKLVTLEGMFLWNRVLWLSIAVAALILTYAKFSFDYAESQPWWTRFRLRSKGKSRQSTQEASRSEAIIVPLVRGSFGSATSFRQMLAIIRASFLSIARNPAGLIPVILVSILSAIFGSYIMTQFGIPLIPSTPQLISFLTASASEVNTHLVIIPMLIIYFAGQLVWSDRDARINDIADAMPVPEWTLLSGKFLGLTLIIVSWLSILMVGGIGMQAVLGYYNFEIGLYLETLFGLQLIDYALFALLAIVVHALVNHKTAGYLVMVVIFLFMAFPSVFQVEHSMLIFNAGPSWTYSDMRGFSSTIWPWFVFKLYWLAWAVLLAILARLLWPRGREQRFRHRITSARLNFTKSTWTITTLNLLALLVLAGYIFYNTNILNHYMTNADINERKALYELRYGKYRNSPQPHLRFTKLNMEIYPDQHQVDIRATYTLVNHDSVSIDSIHFGSISGIEPREIKFDRLATNVVSDKTLCHYIYSLQEPLAPGDSLHIDFVVHYERNGFSDKSSEALVTVGGTYFTNYDLLPSVGYQHFRELDDAILRKQYQLHARPAIASVHDKIACQKPFTTDQNTFEAVIGTAKDEVAIAPGALKRMWSRGNRSYFHFKTDAAIAGEYSILSAKYEVTESYWNHMSLRIYHHPDHGQNVDRIGRSVRASLEYYTQQFGEYPYGHLTIIERPGMFGGASSKASMIEYDEQFAEMNPDDSPAGFDLPYYIVAHEVAHQWWGGARLTPANVAGAGVLIEGLAVYSGMQVLEKNYGENHVHEYLNYLHEAYEMPRSLATPPLLEANEAFLYYRKGGLAMYALSKYIGKEKINHALQSFLDKRSAGELKLPTTFDLYREIQSVTPDSLNYLLEDLFEQNTYWRLKAKQFVATQTPEGNWQVTLKVNAQKVVVDSTGSESERPMQDWLEVGIYDENNLPLYLQLYKIHSGEQIIRVTVPRKPQLAGIDPNKLMIDLRVDDNLIELEE